MGVGSGVQTGKGREAVDIRSLSNCTQLNPVGRPLNEVVHKSEPVRLSKDVYVLHHSMCSGRFFFSHALSGISITPRRQNKSELTAPVIDLHTSPTSRIQKIALRALRLLLSNS